MLIQAASGGVGRILIQLAKHKGCTVFATASTGKQDYLKEMGVDYPIDYLKEDFSVRIPEILGDKKLDVVFDNLGGKRYKQGLNLLGPGGKIVSYGAADQNKGSKTSKWGTIKVGLGFGFHSPIKLVGQSKAMIGVNMLRIADHKPHILKNALDRVMELCESGIIDPRLDKIFAADQIAEAHDYLESRKSKGKLQMKKVLSSIGSGFVILALAIIGLSNTQQVCGQNKLLLENYRQNLSENEFKHFHITEANNNPDPQNIHIISIPLESLKSKYHLNLVWSDSIKQTTSSFAENSGAVAAINAGFFNVKEGGSVTYLEYENERVARRSWRGDTHSVKKTNMNGALILSNSGEIIIEKARSSYDYLNSYLEVWVLVTGPLLIQDGVRSRLLPRSFVDNRHPRTAVGVTNEKLLLITVDGRHSKAKGMTLPELQDFLSSLGCIQAINLDGGGSTTMWLNIDSTMGVVNCPSDNRKFDHKGERKVANALVLLSN